MNNQHGGKRTNSGRPKVEEKMVSKTIRFLPSEWSKLEKLARQQAISTGKLIRQLLNR